MPQINAVRWHGKEDVRLDSIEIKSLNENEVRLIPAYCGLCGSDVGKWLHGPQEYPPELVCTIGHEFSAVVGEVHYTVSQLQKGDRVIVNPMTCCGRCHMCIDGQPNVCEDSHLHGFDRDGALTESLTVHVEQCHKIPESIPLDIAALVEPLSVGWQAVLNSGIRVGQSAMVIGTGPVGLATIASLKAFGIEEILVIGRSEFRNELVRQWGISDIYSSAEEGILMKIKSHFEGVGPHVVFDAAAAQPAVDLGIDCVRNGGLLYCFGIYHQKISIQLDQVFSRALTIKGNQAYTNETMTQVIDAISDGRLSIDLLRQWITAQINFADVQEKGLKELVANKAKHMKIMVKINDVE